MSHDVIGKGSFGCVLKPAVLCNDLLNQEEKESEERENTHKISKLMRTKDATIEMDKLNSIKQLLHDLPNYDDYFILDVQLCKPKKSNGAVLKRCGLPGTLYQHPYIILNMLDGGLHLDHIFDDIYNNDHQSVYRLEDIHHKLVELFQYAIMPMNERGVYHCDIKALNILYDQETNKIKLIDWGYGYIVKNDHPQIIPHVYYDFSFHYNFPFGTVLLSTYFAEEYEVFFQEYKDEKYADFLFHFVIYFIYNIIDKYQPRLIWEFDSMFKNYGIFKFGEVEIINNEYKEHSWYPYNQTIHIIAYILAGIIRNENFCNRNRKFIPLLYFQRRYLHDVDVYGFLSIYLELLNYRDKNTIRTTPMRDNIKAMLRTHLYSFENQHQEINKEEVLANLQQLLSSQRGGGRRRRKSSRKYSKKKHKKNKRKTRKSF